MIKLYQFPISHFCEKVRWALEYKGVPYEQVNLMPGRHISVIKGLAPKSCVPVLVDDDKVIQDSAAILTYLDEKYPERSLTPVNPAEKAAALEWERYLNGEFGIHVRRFCYHWILQSPGTAVPLLAHKGPWYAGIVLRLAFGKLSKIMRKSMNISQETAEESRQHILAALERVNHQLEKQPFLVGSSFSRADLTAAALLAPLCMPAKYPISLNRSVPTEIAELNNRIQPQVQWLYRWYDSYR
ncbi:glutathione S-transferase [Hahella sp. CCB-MM4]|uniref:glutathione S-transferase family protein n=1 Tax=Hahella sp. (strain CCB-MM4) TaxID=1926491 RepID=UPI000B9AA934|nr:glutathione S-transferase family protein [Hahella sp. CCB-MM4]OZG72259.1 glutathione S-transferase [Hahella sp. CCB-MM4]